MSVHCRWWQTPACCSVANPVFAALLIITHSFAAWLAALPMCNPTDHGSAALQSSLMMHGWAVRRDTTLAVRHLAETNCWPVRCAASPHWWHGRPQAALH